ncbi:MAG: hypothetical protein ACW97O_17175, partial [Candidatus Thorarchaeota archaeon]
MIFASAVHDDGLFELGDGTEDAGTADIFGDGNEANGLDWADVFDANGEVSNLGEGLGADFIQDERATKGSRDGTTFSNVSKNGGLLSDWGWASGNVPAKDDLSNVYAYVISKPSEKPDQPFDDLILYAGLERIDPGGDSHLDIEIFQAPIQLENGQFIGERTVNDLLLVVDYIKGGDFANFEIYIWNGDQWVLVGDPIPGEGCNADDTACAFNNGKPVDGGPWPNYDRQGGVEELEPNAFTEMGVNLTQIAETSFQSCEITYLAKSRTSQSLESDLKDFAFGSITDLCDAKITISEDTTNEVGESHAFTVSVEKKDGSTNFAWGPVANVIVTGTLNKLGGTSEFDEFFDDQPVTCTTDLDGTCTINVASDFAGMVGVTATTDNFAFPDGTTVPLSTSATKTWVDALVHIGAAEGELTEHEIANHHSLQLTAEVLGPEGQGENDPWIWQKAADVAVDAILYESGALNGARPIFTGDTVPTCGTDGQEELFCSSTCTTTSPGGTCTLTVNSPTTGQAEFWGHADVIMVGGIEVSRTSETSTTATWQDHRVRLAGLGAHGPWEPQNNTPDPENAVPIASGDTISSIISHPLDLDFYRFTVSETSNVEIDLTKLSADYDLVVFRPSELDGFGEITST